MLLYIDYLARIIMLINLALCFYSKTMLKCYIQVYAADTSTVVLVILDPSRFQPFSQY